MAQCGQVKETQTEHAFPSLQHANLHGCAALSTAGISWLMKMHGTVLPCSHLTDHALQG